MSSGAEFPRDLFIEQVFHAAKKDRDIFFISADFGAPALDNFRENLPKQFIHSGISEQHMINMAAGLALSGKKVYAYAMAPFLALRCFEQIKGTLSLMHQPVTLVSVGVGLAYADSGPTHYITEDLACLRALNGMEALTASDSESATELANLTIDQPGLRYIRLDRQPLLPIYNGNYKRVLKSGVCEIFTGEKACIVTSGYMISRAIAARQELLKEGLNVGVIDLFRTKPMDIHAIKSVLTHYQHIITLEEQGLDAGFGSALLELLNDHLIVKTVKRMGLPSSYIFENGGRDFLLDQNGLSVASICKNIKSLNQ